MTQENRLERLKHKWKYNEYQYLDIIELIEALIKQNDDLKQELEEANAELAYQERQGYIRRSRIAKRYEETNLNPI